MKPCDQTCTSSNDPSVFSSHPLSQEASFLDSQLSFASVPSLAASPQHQCHVLIMNHRCVATLKGQNSYTSSLLLSGGFFFTGSSDREIRLWKHDARRSMMDFENLTGDNMVVAGKGAVKALVASEDKIISAHQDHKIRVWKIDNLDNDHQKFTHLATLPTLNDRLKIFLPKNHVQVRRHKTCTWVHHVDTVSALAISSDESLLYSVSWDRTLKIWRTTDFKCLVSTLEKHKSGVNALALSRDGSTLYSGAGDRSILVWTKTAGSGHMAAVGALRGHTKSILCLATVSDLVCSGSADNTVRIWRGTEKSYSCIAVLEGHKGPVKCITVAFDPTSETTSTYFLYSASLDLDIKVWQIFLPPE